MKITYASFDAVPSFKAASTHILANCRRAMQSHKLLLLSLGEVALPANPGFCHAPAAIREKNYLRRGEAFRDYVHRQLQASRPDVFHFRTPWEGLLAGRLKLANVYEVNGLPSIELPYHYRTVSPRALAVFKSWEQACLEHADAIVCPSERIRRCLLDRYVIPDPARISVIPNGYDPVACHPRQADSLPLKAVYLGTLNHWQGILWALKGFVPLRGLYTLDIFGSATGKMAHYAEKRILRHGLAGHARLHGPLHRADLDRQLRQYQVGLAPLLKTERNTDQGCCPVKIMDYLNHGLVTVAPDLAVVRAMLANGDNGILYLPNCMHSFVAAMQGLAHNREAISQLSHNAQASLARFPTWDECSERILEIYGAIARNAAR